MRSVEPSGLKGEVKTVGSTASKKSEDKALGTWGPKLCVPPRQAWALSTTFLVATLCSTRRAVASIPAV